MYNIINGFPFFAFHAHSWFRDHLKPQESLIKQITIRMLSCLKPVFKVVSESSKSPEFRFSRNIRHLHNLIWRSHLPLCNQSHVSSWKDLVSYSCQRY